MLNRKDLYLILVIFLACAVLCLPLILPMGTVVVEESYLQLCSYLDLNRTYMLRNPGLPQWAFHFGGGYPFIKHPDNIILSPLFYLLILPFGSADGFKLLLLFSYFVGGAGFFLFARKIMGYGRPASFISALFFALNSFIPFQINTGNIMLQAWFYLPLICLTLFLAGTVRKHLFYCSLLVALTLYNAMGLAWASMALFLFLLAALDPIPPDGKTSGGGRNLLLVLGAVFGLAFLLSAAKLLPMIDLLRENIRPIDDYSAASAHAMTIRKMFLSFFSRGPYAVGNESAMGPNGLGMGSVMYFGVIPAVFFAFSCVLCFRKIWKYLAAMAIFLLLCMAGNSPLDLFRLLWNLPLFHSMHEAARYFSFPVVFCAAVISGAFFGSSYFKNLGKKARLAVYALALLGAVNMLAANSRYYAFTSSYQEPVPEARFDNEFFSVMRVRPDGIERAPFFDPARVWKSKYAAELATGLQYYMFRQNIGVSNWYGNINLRENAIPRYGVLVGYGDHWKDLRRAPYRKNGVIPNDKYRGESFFLKNGSNRTGPAAWKTNMITVPVDQSTPDILVVNQNYDSEWKTDRGRITEVNGLIGVVLDKPVKGPVTLRYASRTFFAGLALSLAALLACLFYFFVLPRMRFTRGKAGP